jgi:hypothetical protein
MSRALRLLACTLLCWGMGSGVAAASCASEAEILRNANADFDVHVVHVRPRHHATVEVDAVRRGAVKVGELLPVTNAEPNTSVSRPFALGERYRLLVRSTGRPLRLTICSAWTLPGRIDVSTPAEGADGLGALGIAAVLAGFGAVLSFVLVKRRRDAL